MIPDLSCKTTDYGDLIHVERWIVKGKHYQLRWHVGVPVDTKPADRVVRGFSYPAPATGKRDLTVDLQADKTLPLAVGWTDEMNNPTEAPADATYTYTVDNPAVINLIDHGDGTADAAPTGTLGTANVHLEAAANGRTYTGDALIVVVAGLAERINIVAGEPVETTPDL